MDQKTAENELASIKDEIKSLGSSSTSHLAKREQELIELKERFLFYYFVFTLFIKPDKALAKQSNIVGQTL